MLSSGLGHAQAPLTTEFLTPGVFQDAPQADVVEIAAQTERETVRVRQIRLYGPGPAHDSAQEQHGPLRGSSVGCVLPPPDFVGPGIENLGALVGSEAINLQHVPKRDSKQTLYGIDVVFGAAHEEGVVAPLRQGPQRDGIDSIESRGGRALRAHGGND